MSRDGDGPASGMAVDRTDGPRFRYDGTTYFSCSSACREEFAGAPGRFVSRTHDRVGTDPRGMGRSEVAPEAAESGVCPVHDGTSGT